MTDWSSEYVPLGHPSAARATRVAPNSNVSIEGFADNVRAISRHTDRARLINLAVKRVFDVAVASVLLVVLAPFFLIVALMIRIESPGSPLFRQERWGKDLRKIKVYKFRSMYSDRCDLGGTKQTVEGDSRITRIGKFIRRSNIDELPQLINVIRGDMSLVGPRCHAIGMLAVGMPYETLVPEYHWRHLMRPGITGLAQVSGYRGPTDKKEAALGRIACDLIYVSKFDFFMDIKVLWLTVVREIVRGRGF